MITIHVLHALSSGVGPPRGYFRLVHRLQHLWLQHDLFFAGHHAAMDRLLHMKYPGRQRWFYRAVFRWWTRNRWQCPRGI